MLSSGIVFQSTPPCGGRPGTLRLYHKSPTVSIHAPVRGATFSPAYVIPLKRVSIHAPVRGATGVLAVDVLQANGFNPRPRAGGDRVSAPVPVMSQVSIHAPVRGATSKPLGVVSILDCFNPRPRAGGDGREKERVGVAQSFQSTPPCGGRPHSIIPISYPLFVSIHAPVRGATKGLLFEDASRFVSIHAPVRGATSALINLSSKETCFNPRPRAGGDFNLLFFPTT